MADFTKIIKNSDSYAKYMADEITHVCNDIPKRGPGSEGEKMACEYFADVLKNQCGCERSEVERYKEHPNAFYGWIYITVTCALLAMVAFFFIPILGVALYALGYTIMFLEFGFYKKVVDKLFPEKIGSNVTAIKKCTGETKARILFNGHPDAAWSWTFNEKFNGKVHNAVMITAIMGTIASFVICIVASVVTKCGVGIANPIIYGEALYYTGFAVLIFVPSLIGMYFLWNEKKVVDGASDNLSGCLISIAILKALKDEGIELEHTEVGVVLTGSEEAGLRGSKAWCEAHKGEFDDVPTWIYSLDTLQDPKHLMINYRNLNGTVKADKEVSDSFLEAAEELGIHCKKGMVPPFGGATDGAAFSQAGYRAASVAGMNHMIEKFYHTVYDTADSVSIQSMSECFAIAVKCLENFDKKFGKNE